MADPCERAKLREEALSYMAEGEFGAIREDCRSWKAATAMDEVRKAGRQTEHVVSTWKEELDYCAEMIGLVCLDGEQHGKRIELVVDGHSLERKMPCWVEAGRWTGKIRSRPEHSIDRVSEVHPRANHRCKILSDAALLRLSTSDTTKQVFAARDGDQLVTETQVSMQWTSCSQVALHGAIEDWWGQVCHDQFQRLLRNSKGASRGVVKAFRDKISRFSRASARSEADRSKLQKVRVSMSAMRERRSSRRARLLRSEA